MSDDPSKDPDLTGLEEFIIQPDPIETGGTASEIQIDQEEGPEPALPSSEPSLELPSEPDFSFGEPEALGPVDEPLLDEIGGNEMETIKKISEQTPIGNPELGIPYPFSLKIEGSLTLAERARLESLLSQDDFGIAPADLTLQIESGKILIPRISEYAGIFLVRQFQDSTTQMTLAPADSVFSSASTEARSDDLIPVSAGIKKASIDSETHHTPADQIQLITGAPPERPQRYQVIGTLSASATLQSHLVEVKQSQEYQDLLESLQRELKFKAYRRGADLITHLTVTLTPLADPRSYRLLLMGTSVATRDPSRSE